MKQLLLPIAFLLLCSNLPGEETPKLLEKPEPFVEHIEPSFEKLVDKQAHVEWLGEGFQWTEGPVWVKAKNYLLFSDIPNNRINKWEEGIGTSVFMEHSGYIGPKYSGTEPGTNGLAIDANGKLCMCEHGNRRISRLNDDGSRTILASRYQGKRFNSPNDLVFHSNGNLYFTDPPYGLPLLFEDPARELDWCGVYLRRPDGQITLLTKEMTRPNGIAFSPDEKTLYVAQSDLEAAIWKSFPVQPDGTIGEGKLFFDATQWMEQEGRPGAPDGMAIDQQGNIWATGPGGVLIFTPQGKLIGRISTGQRTANCCFGGDGSTLYMAADDFLCRIQTKAKGIGF